MWLARANALRTTCDSRSYAQVLKQGKAVVKTEQLNEKVQPVEKQKFTASFSKPKNIRKTQKSSQKRDKIQDTTVFTQTVSQRHLIPTSNRFQILQYDLQGVEHDWDSLDKAFVGNKNKTGKSLGQSHTHVKQQNKGQHAGFKTLDTCPVQDTFNFKGNKNGNGSKLGHMHTTKAHTHNLMSDKQSYGHQVKANPVDNKNKIDKLLGHSLIHVDQQDCSQNACSSTLVKCPVQVPFNFKGNKNGNGAKLDHMHITTEDMKHYPMFDNHNHGYRVATNIVAKQNKVGKFLEQSINHEEQQDGSQNACFDTFTKCPVQVPFNFEGNKNGIGSKLGHEHTTTEDISDNLMSSNRIHDHHITTNPAPILFSGNKNGNGTKLGLQAGQDKAGEISISRSTSNDALYLSDLTVTDVQVPSKRARQIPSEVYATRFQSIDHKNCLYQNDKNFGFIPLNDLMVYTGPEITWGTVPDIIEAHAKVRRSGLPNFMEVRIPLKTQLKVPCWKKYLDNYWDQQLVDLIQFGFPLDFDRQIVLQSTEVNHSSALKYPDHVSRYIQEELQYGAVLGPFKQFPFHCHVSPTQF